MRRSLPVAGAVVLVTMVVAAAAAWSSLPSQMAWQWSTHRPTVHAARWVVLGAPIAVFAAELAVITASRRSRAGGVVVLLVTAGWLGWFEALELWSNVGAATWERAKTSFVASTSVSLVALGAIAVTYVVRRTRVASDAYKPTGPSPDVAVDGPMLWSGSASNLAALIGGVASLAVGVVVVALTLGTGGAVLPAVGAMVGPTGIGVSMLCLSRVRVTVGPAQVVIAFGPWGWPRYRHPYAELGDASVTTPPGGWGRRRFADVTSLNIRAGDALRLDRRGGHAVVVSLDGAAEAAGVIRGYLGVTAGAA